MKKTGKLIVILLLSVHSIVAQSNAVNISATTDKQVLGINQTVRYRISIEGSSNSNPQVLIPGLEENFTVRSQSRRQSISSINGSTTVTYILDLIIQPKAIGDVIISPVTYTDNGSEYTSKEVRIRVTEAVQEAQDEPSHSDNSASQNSQIFGKSTVSHPSVYVGEQVIYSLHLFRRVRLWSTITFEMPEFEGFWVEDLPVREDQYIGQVNRQNFYVQDLVKKALFPIKEGTYEIPASRISFLLNPFQGESVVQSQTQTITVKPLPSEGQPAYFSGLVGDVTLALTSSIESTVSQNIPIQVTITLSGTGGLTRVADLFFKETPEFNIYKSKIYDDVISEQDMSSKRTFEYIIIPRKPGEHVIPMFKIATFSPSEKKYTEHRVGGTTINVVPNEDTMQRSTENVGVFDRPIELRYIKVNYNPQKDSQFFWKNSIFMLFLLLILGALMTQMGIIIKRRFIKNDTQKKQHFHAFSKAQKQLKIIKKNTESKTFYSQLQAVLIGYISDRMGKSMHGLTHLEIKEECKKRNVPDSLLDACINVLERISEAAFSPSGKSNKIPLLESVESLIERLRKEAKEL